MSDQWCAYKLGLAICSLTPVEALLHAHFQWQTSQSWITAAQNDVPLVVMSDMPRSPAVLAVHKLIQVINDDGTSLAPADGLPECPIQSFVQVALYLHEGWHGQSRQTYVSVSVYGNDK